MIYRRGATSRVLAAGVAAVLLAGPSWAASSKRPKPPAGSELSGRIRMADGKSPARGAVIEVRPLGGGAAHRSSPSDKNGRFSLRGLPYGWAEVVVVTDGGGFLGDQAINLPPGSKVKIDLTLLLKADRPDSWWVERHLEVPTDIGTEQVAGLAQSSQRLTGVEYWKSPTGIAVLVTVGVAALAIVAAGGRSYTAP